MGPRKAALVERDGSLPLMVEDHAELLDNNDQRLPAHAGGYW